MSKMYKINPKVNQETGGKSPPFSLRIPGRKRGETKNNSKVKLAKKAGTPTRAEARAATRVLAYISDYLLGFRINYFSQEMIKRVLNNKVNMK